MDNIILISVSAFVASALIQFIAIRLSHKYNFFIDSHTDKKPQNFHKISTPRSGGIGIALSMLLLLFTPFGWKLIISIALAFTSGIFEDFYHTLKPKFRLLLQFIAASSAVFLTNSVITYLGFGISLPYWLGIVFSIFAIIGMMNAINFIDGFNGLASGVSMLSLLAFSIVAFKVDNYEIFSLCIVVMAAILGFFIFNFPRGKIFLGDGGAYLLGFITAIIGISLGGSYDVVSPWFVLTVIIYPVWEVLFSIFRRVCRGKSSLNPDAYHLHSLIYKHLTYSNPLTTVVILCAVAPFVLIPALFYANHSASNFFTTIVFIVLYLTVYRYLYKKEISD